MKHRRKRMIFAAVVVALLAIIVAHFHLLWQAQSAKFQSMEVLGRSIAVSFVDQGSTITVPATGWGLKDAEVIAMNEHFSVYAHPKSWLTAQRLPF